MHCISKPDSSVEYGKHVNHFEQAAKKLKNQEGMAVDEASNNSEPKTKLSDGESSEDVQEDSPLIAPISKLVFGDICTSKKGWKRKVGTMRAEQ
ncbi:hypothetical protein CROQUDRAFT_656200 [Cronartium quercuum f. sp. fusiforme G11]|uniref:Uncharacterized protein n=1 Tax=Cronartium quercuum f. sp. fusiforme G11 TaxID=708437 RepID=A0A9P6NI84_9BASI|nr:hypothetical protein CROQUDRAFT_656200 [Cronartium quercuum f. sp. fusiforme G11]